MRNSVQDMIEFNNVNLNYSKSKVIAISAETFLDELKCPHERSRVNDDNLIMNDFYCECHTLFVLSDQIKLCAS